MPARRLTWRRLTPGLVMLAALVAMVVSILAFARVGALHGDSYQFEVLAGDAGGVLKGTEVWVAGQRVGVVTGVAFRPVSTDTLARLAVRVQVQSRYRDAIRHDSRVSFHAGGTPIGAIIVAIDVGSPHAPVVRAGDTIRAVPTIDRDSLRDQLALAARQLPALLRDAKAASTGIRRAMGALDTATRDGRPAVEMMTGEVDRIASARGRGTLPRLLHDGELSARARRTMARAESLLSVAHDTGSLTRILTDSTLLRRLADTRDALAIIHLRLASEHGTAGRLARDTALVRELARLGRNIDSVIADVQRRPGKYAGF